MKNLARQSGAVWGLLTLFCSAICAQPPTTAVPPQPALPSLTLADMEALFGKPVQISANFQNKPLPDALEELARQSGIEFVNGNTNSVVNWQANNLPLWPALHDLLTSSGLTIGERDSRRSFASYEMNIRVVPKNQTVAQEVALKVQQIHPYVALSFNSASATEAQNIVYSRLFAGANYLAGQRRTMRLETAVLLDPRLATASTKVQMRVDALSVADKEIKGFPAGTLSVMDERIENPLIDFFLLAFAFDKAADGDAPKAQLKGKIIMDVVTRRETWEINDVLNAKDASKTFKSADGDLVLTLEGVTKEQRRYAVKLRGQLRKGDKRYAAIGMVNLSESPLESWTKRVQVFDAKGIEYEWGGTSHSWRDDAIHASVNLHARRDNGQTAPGEPQKMVIEVPTEVRQLEIPFEIKDLPLP